MNNLINKKCFVFMLSFCLLQFMLEIENLT
jgi:hypothetical protein